jgi:4-cresol dehydrogenase (hydroxylating) flavoprotein subunit
MADRSFISLPSGITQASFQAAVEKFTAILGESNVLTDAEHLAPYMKIMMPVDEREHAPSAALMATEVSQVQKIVQVCNQYKVPVWPISTGKNFGYGSAPPVSRGQVILDLKRMNKIIEVDPDLCTALVEPGVTYQQLYDYIHEKKYALWLDPPAPSAIVSPVGNTLDRGVGYTPYGEHFMFQCGMEVVMPNGDLLRTGMGGIPNSNTWQVFKWGFGPYLDGIFTQSNYGIVTKLGFWLMPAPEDYRPFAIRYPDEGDIEGIVETLRPLSIAGVIPNAMVFVSAIYAAVTVVKRSDYYQGKGVTPDSVIQQIIKDHKLGAWTVYAALYGTREQNDVNWKIVTDTIKRSGKGVIVTAAEASDSPDFHYRAELSRGNMNLQEFGLYNWYGGGGSLWFAPVSQARGRETLKQVRMAKEILNKHGLDYVGEFIVGGRAMHHIIDMLFDRTDPATMKAAHACFTELLDEFTKAGYGTYRVNTAFMDKVADSYGPVKRRVNQTIKRALDPNGIIAPGKSGIWV